METSLPAVEPAANPQCCKCNDPIVENENGELPKGTVRRGRSKATLICAHCNAAGVKLHRAHVSTASLERLPEELKARFWKDARSVMGPKIAEYMQNVIEKCQMDEFSEGREAKFMPMKYYTDLGFNEDKIKELVTGDDVRQTPLATLYRINIHCESETSASGSKRSELLTASPASPSKRKKGDLSEPTPKRSKVSLASLDPNPEKWTSEEHEAWQEHKLKQINQLSHDIGNKMLNNSAFQHGAPNYVKDDATNLQNDLGALRNKILDKPLEDLIAVDINEMSKMSERFKVLLKSASAFIKAHRAYGTPTKSASTPAEEPKAKGKTAGKAKAKGKAKAGK